MPSIQILLETSMADYIFNSVSDCEIPDTSTRYLLSFIVMLKLEGSAPSEYHFFPHKESDQIQYFFLGRGWTEVNTSANVHVFHYIESSSIM